MIVLLDVENGLLRQACGECKRERDLPIADLQLGVSGGPDVVEMPPCQCGAQEFLVRTWDAAPEEFRGSAMDLHRRQVNALAQLLKKMGQSHPLAREAHAAEKGAPPDLPAA